MKPKIMCCLCFKSCTKAELNQVAPFIDGSIEDVCHECAEWEKQELLMKNNHG